VGGAETHKIKQYADGKGEDARDVIDKVQRQTPIWATSSSIRQRPFEIAGN
jgi:hypothetical protein